MKNIFDPICADEIHRRIAALRPGSAPQWGKMELPEALAHCSKGLEMAAGEIRPPRALIGRFIGTAIKRVVVRDDKPLHHNSPTANELKAAAHGEFEAERTRLSALLNRFAGNGPAGCTSHPHPFFGPLTPEEWAILMYKHLDHHLRQFGA